MARTRHLSYGFIITSTTGSAKDPCQLLRSALEKCKEGEKVGIFLIGDGVYIATTCPKNDESARTIQDAMRLGAEVLVSKDHLEASGLNASTLPNGAVLVDKPYRELVSKVMEEWDRVVVC